MKRIKSVGLLLVCMLLLFTVKFDAQAETKEDTPKLESVVSTRDSGVRLTWSASSNATDLSQTKYMILRSSDDGKSFQGVVNREAKYGLYFVDATSEIEVGKTYYYKVREYVNGERLQDSNVLSVTVQKTAPAENEFADKESAANYLKEQMVARKETISVIYNAPSFPSGVMAELYDMAREDSEEASAVTAKEGDYLRYTIIPGTIKLSSGIDGKVGSDTSYTFTYSLKYYTSAAEEAVLDEEVEKILRSFEEKGITSASSAYDRARAVYDYIATNVHYNNGKRSDNGNIMITAYDCLVRKEAQCYGQLLGAYRLLKELDLPARRVNGTATVTLGNAENPQKVNHGWLIVEIDDVWYNFDVTAAGSYYEGYGQKNLCTYKYLLVSDADLGGKYVRDTACSADAFVSAHPMTETSYGFEPEAPQTLTVSFGRQDETNDLMIKVSYSAVEDAEGYVILRSNSANGTFRKVYEGSALSYEDTDIKEGNEYHYKVQAYKQVEGYDCYSAYSSRRYYNFKSIKVGSVGTLRCESYNYNSVTLSWDKATNAAFYDVYRATSPDGTYEKIATVSGTTYTNNGLPAGVMYYYKVAGWCYGSGGKNVGIIEQSEYSNTLAAKAVLSAPTIAVKNSGYNSVTVSWNTVEGAAYYEVYGKKATETSYKKYGPYDAKTLSKLITKLETGKEYWFKVRCYRFASTGKVYSNYSKVLSVKPALLTPMGVKASGNTYNSVKVTWNSVEEASYYQLWRSTSADGKYVKLGTYKADTLSGISRQLACGTKYYYKVRAYKVVNGKAIYSDYSKPVNATPTLKAPVKVTAKRKTASSVSVGWSKVDGATFYQVYRATSANGKYALIGTYDANTTGSVSKSLKTGTKYYYKVRGYRWQNGKRVFSGFSKIVTATP